jgi:predicted TIM-barrel fold metal-dependent hydrolase
MRLRIALFAALTAIPSAWTTPSGIHAQTPMPMPGVDHHQHLYSPALVQLFKMTPPVVANAPVVSASDLVRHLNEVGIKRAVVHSTAYIFSQPSRKMEDDATLVRVENDWISQQVAMFPDRLVGFCSVNPLKDYALAEIARCAKDANLRRGLKLHCGNATVDYHDTDHLARLRGVFAAANENRMAIVVHMRASISDKLPYGRDEARVFLNELVAAAPDVPIQVAHLAGAGGYNDPLVDEAVSVFVEAIQKGDRRTKQLWFDVSSVALGNPTVERKELLAQRIRQLGVQRMLYGSDAPTPGLLRADWEAFRQLPLASEEFMTIATNVAPYLR